MQDEPISHEAALTRRGFVAGSAALAGHALATQPVQATTIATDETGLVAGVIRIPAADGEISGYRARPSGDGAYPVVLVVHEIFGVHEYIRDVCRRLAGEGYLAIAPALFERQGDVATIRGIPEIIDKVVSKVPDAQVLSDLDATVAWAKASGEGDVMRLAITGFCWGGRFAWTYTAHNRSVRAAAPWYGRLVGEGPGVLGELAAERTYPIDVADRLGAPVLGLYAERDGGIPLATVEQMRAALAKAGDPSRIIVYPGATHGFHADYRPFYHEQAAKAGWAEMLAWFRAHGVR